MLSELGWAPTTSWEDGLRQTVEWYTDGKNVARWDKARLSKEISGRHSNGVVAPPRAGDPFWPMPVQDCKLTYLKYYPDNRGIFSELTNTTKDVRACPCPLFVGFAGGRRTSRNGPKHVAVWGLRGGVARCTRKPGFQFPGDRDFRTRASVYRMIREKCF